MSSAQERPAGTAGTTDPTGGSAATGPGDTAGRTAAAGTGTPGYERAGAHRGAGYQEAGYQETAEWEGAAGSPGRAGGIMLAAVLMIFSGLVTFFYGIVGVIHGTFFTTVPNYVFTISPRGRGLVDLIIGAVIFAAGVCVLLGMLWARIVGVVLAVISAIANFMFLPWYPFWSIIVIALDVFIIWALTTGGRERRLADR
jgi:hypothetical protein